MIKRFDTFNESIRDKMTPKSEEDTIRAIKRRHPSEILDMILKNRFNDYKFDLKKHFNKEEIREILDEIDNTREWLDTIFKYKFNDVYTTEEIKERISEIRTDNLFHVISDYNLMGKYTDEELYGILYKLNYEVLETINTYHLERLVDKKLKDRIRHLGGFSILTDIVLYGLGDYYTTEELKDLISDLDDTRYQLKKIEELDLFNGYSEEELREMIDGILPQNRHYFVKKYDLQHLFSEKELDKLRRMYGKDYDTAMKIYNEDQ